MNAELYYYVCGIILVAGMILWIFFSSFLRRVFSDHLYFGGWRPREFHVRMGFCFVSVGLTFVFPNVAALTLFLLLWNDHQNQLQLWNHLGEEHNNI